jgi:hypothetical protein
MSAERDTTAGNAGTEGHQAATGAAANAALMRVAAFGPAGQGAPPTVTQLRTPIGSAAGSGTESPKATHATGTGRDRGAPHESRNAPADRPPDLWVPFLVLSLSAAAVGMLVLARETRL